MQEPDPPVPFMLLHHPASPPVPLAFPPSLSFFLCLVALWHVELLGQGSDPGCSHDLGCSCGNAGSLTHVAGLGVSPASSAPRMLLIPYGTAGTPLPPPSLVLWRLSLCPGEDGL